MSLLNQGKYYFFGYESIYGRVGVDLHLKHMNERNKQIALKEIEQIYKDRWGYKNVIVKPDPNDPYICQVFVMPNKPYGNNIIY